jgi:hypothetical protein
MPEWCAKSFESSLSGYPRLAAARRFTLARIQLLEAMLRDTGPALAPLESVAAAGSVGRLEAGEASDLDCLLITSPATHADEARAHAVRAVIASVAHVGWRAPKPDGIYREPITVAALCDPAARGRLDESPAVFGKRIQLLLDARPLFGHGAFVRARSAVVDWYLGSPPSAHVQDPWRYLARDLARYAHAYCNWQSYKVEHGEGDSWYLRQAKLRSSRYVTWMGLWLLLLEMSRSGRLDRAWLLEHLDLTPLERVGLVLGAVAPTLLDRVLGYYDTMLDAVRDLERRRELVSSPHAAERFGEIAKASDAMQRCFSDFIALVCTAKPDALWRCLLPF